MIPSIAMGLVLVQSSFVVQATLTTLTKGRGMRSALLRPGIALSHLQTPGGKLTPRNVTAVIGMPFSSRRTLDANHGQ
jgi:hypothetical protein